ncbi:MAG: glycoside hydrolase family 2 protein [Alicyclobacillus sp.]|nr:glycoside hydrolase family 2 protein [Alicyclobacillus sp.]
MSEHQQILHDNWRFRDPSEDAWLPAKVPGCVHMDLRRNGRIPDPFYGTNEGDLQWIDKQDWEYETSFNVESDVFAEEHIDLVFMGLDSYADVSLNGSHILSADNMFRTWRTDVKSLLRAEGNLLRVRFRSPIQEDLPKLERLGYRLPATNDQSERGGLGDKKLSVFARKAPYHYGWDWGPRFVTSGIWRSVRLEGWTGCRITDLFIEQQRVSADVAQLMAHVTVEADKPQRVLLRLSWDGSEGVDQPVELHAGVQVIDVPLTVKQPRLWWSRGLGEQHRYTFSAVVLDNAQTLAERRVITGLRSLRLVQEDDEVGTSFYFELNGIPVFAKGANHIPNDSFLTEITYERYKHEIVTAAASNMNMLRVWGGGIYENDAFYDLCDEYGILVWQDFMFACSMYPGDEAFLENVRIEAEENIRRLRNHPCIALWCGNNEIDTAWSNYDEHAGWGWKQQYTPEQREKIWRDYEAVFHRILPDAVAQFAPGADYWPSSPLQAWTNDARQHARNDSTRGDIHYWGVWHNVEPFSNYNVYLGRFMSEYGFQSFPELRTVQTYAGPGDMELESTVMKWHQRSGDGNRLIKSYMDIYEKQPKDFFAFLYMSQVLQAEAIQMAMEAHRRKKPYCMGSLYWQINDCWPVASWSSMDYYGRWKALQYYAKRSYRDVMVSFGESDGQVTVHVVSDILTPVNGRLDLRLYDFSGNVLREVSQPVHIPANSAVVVTALRPKEWLGGHKAEQAVLRAVLMEDGTELDSKEYYFVPAKELSLDYPHIDITPVADSGGTAFRLETDVLAKNVWLSTESDGVFSDNFFDLIPGVPKIVQFQSRPCGEDWFQPAVPASVQVRSLVDFVQQ